MFWALAISLAVHLAAFGGWKWSQTHPWWRHMRLPDWMQLERNKFVASIAKKLPVPPQPPQQTPMLYIDVDPALASAEPPPNAKYYSSADTRAANAEIKIPSAVPDIPGTQDKMMKTIAPSPKPTPLQPSPPKPESTQTAEAKPPPKPAYAPGDLIAAKAGEKMQETNGTSPDPGAAAKAQPAHERPRTLAEAMAKEGIPGARTRQPGGVAQLAPDSTMDALRTPYGDYDRDFIDAVRSRWYELLADRQPNVPGRVVLEFDLHPDGRITDMTNSVNEVNLLLETFCESAVLDPAPYKPWTEEMRRLITNPRHLVFTFYYEND